MRERSAALTGTSTGIGSENTCAGWLISDEAAAKAAQYDEAILDSSAIEPTDSKGNPIPVTIPIVLAPNITVVYTTRLGGASTDEWAHFNLGGKSGDVPDHVRANRDAR